MLKLLFSDKKDPTLGKMVPLFWIHNYEILSSSLRTHFLYLQYAKIYLQYAKIYLQYAKIYLVYLVKHSL